MRLIYILWVSILLSALPSAFAQYPGGYGQDESNGYSYDDTTIEYTQYYHFRAAVQDGQVSRVEEYVVSGGRPSYLYMGAGHKKIPYSDFSYYYPYGQGNYLWIKGEDSWTDYAEVPKGSSVDLMAISPFGGNAYLYDVDSSGKATVSIITISPYSRIRYDANTVGKHNLYFVINNWPSNSVVVDVQAVSPFTGFGYNWARVNLVSDWKGYTVYIDDVFALTEGTGGVPDGIANFPVRGGGVHKITISLNGQSRSTEQYFETDAQYNINL